MAKAKRFYDVLVNGEVVYHGATRDAHNVFVAVTKAFKLSGQQHVPVVLAVSYDGDFLFL